MVWLSSDDKEGEELPLHMPYSNTSQPTAEREFFKISIQLGILTICFC
jgi:hypothetical protein